MLFTERRTALIGGTNKRNAQKRATVIDAISDTLSDQGGSDSDSREINSGISGEQQWNQETSDVSQVDEKVG